MISNEERLVVLGRLSSMLAHEIRNPLAGISAATQMLGGKLDASDPKHKYVRMILAEIERVNGLVKNLLDYSRDGRACMMRADLRAILETVFERFADRLNGAGVQVETHFAPDLPFPVCDREMMGQVFTQLTSNALDAMSDGGRLTVHATADPAGEHVRVRFEDTGVGAETDDLGELFSPFYTTKTKGSGLGLPVALKCIEEHGGTIRAERRVPRGLAVTVEWPVNPSAGKPTA